MKSAYVLIYSKTEVDESIMSRFDRIDEVKEVILVDGPFDIVIKMESAKREQIKNILAKKIKEIPEIKNLITLSVVD